MFTARHVVRQLGLGEDAFPLSVSSLLPNPADAAAGGTATVDPMTPPRIQVIDRFEFASLKEVRP